ncbi:hypothetical protein MN608_09500 [Microdochium nivale]|nr:hypothetical protein MN608_09500 [Microdochium nivale]
MAHHQSPQQPLLPRMFLFEIDDQPWFPPFLRARVQAGLTHAWTARIPFLQPATPASLVADILHDVVGPDRVSRYTFIDFCSGAGGPTPHIERQLNRRLLLRAIDNSSTGEDNDDHKHHVNGDDTNHNDDPTYAEVAQKAPASEVSPSHEAEPTIDSTLNDAPSYADAAKLTSMNETSPHGSNHTENTHAVQELIRSKQEETRASSSSSSSSDTKTETLPGVDFILTDLHPHLSSWEEAARSSARLHYVAEPVNAAAARRDLVSQATTPGGGDGPVPGRDTFRLFSLAFHHFDDPAARSILRDTLATSSGFGIFELQERSLASFATCLAFGAGVFLFSLPMYWWSPLTLLFVYAVPLIPFVLVFDGFVSSLRTRTPAEIETLLRSCGDKEFDAGRWELRSGRQRFLWPTGHLNWVICTKKVSEEQE